MMVAAANPYHMTQMGCLMHCMAKLGIGKEVKPAIIPSWVV